MLNINCLITKENIEEKVEFYLIPITKEKSFRPVEITKDNEKYNIYSYTHSSCYANAYWDYFAPMIKVYHENDRFYLIEEDFNLKNFKKLMENITEGNVNNCSNMYIKDEDYSYNQYNTFLNKIFKELNNIIEVKNRNKTMLNFSCVSKQVVSYVSKNYPKKQSLMDKENFKKLFEENLKNIKNEKNPIKRFMHMRCDIDYPFVTNSSRGLINKYPQKLIEILSNYSEKVDIMDIDDVEFINNLYIELKTFLEHLEIDRLLDDLNIKLQPIVFFENKSNKKYLSMVNFVKSQVNKDVKKRYN